MNKQLCLTILDKQECEASYIVYNNKIETTWLQGRLYIFVKVKTSDISYTELYIPVDNIECMEVELSGN